MYKKIIFPYYKGNIRLTKVIGLVSYERFVASIKNPKEPIKNKLKQIVLAKEAGNKILKKELKKQLFSFTPAVLINVGSKRNYNSIIEFTGLMQLDFDNIESKEEAIELKEIIFSLDYTLCSFISPSGYGVKALIKITKCRNIAQYKAIHKAVKKSLNIKEFDIATKNAVLPLYISYDKNILYRSYADAGIFKDEDWTDETAISLIKDRANAVYVPDGNETQRGKNYREKTLRIAKEKINNIVDNGHTQVLSASLILGSRIAAGYVGYNEALNTIISEVINNEYLSKGTRNYINTVKWGVDKGYKNGAKYY